MKRGWVLACGLFLAGCAAAPYEEDVQWAPEAPPPERAEIPGPPETPGPAWVSGRWERTEQGWSWRAGRYVEPPGEDHVWISGSWAEEEGKWKYSPGRWRASRAVGMEPVPGPGEHEKEGAQMPVKPE